MSDVTQILRQLEHGDLQGADELLPLVYDELKKLAAIKLGREKPGQTIQATALVHEAFVRLVDNEQAQNWNSRGHFFGAASEAMRRVLVERARHKATLKAGGDFDRVELANAVTPDRSPPHFDLMALDAALKKLESTDPRRASVVKLRFFGGLTNGQAAKALGIARSTVDADWAYAKCWLRVEIDGHDVEPA